MSSERDGSYEVPPPLIGVRVVQFRSVSSHGAGCVDEDIRMAEFLPDRFEGGLDAFRVGDVESVCKGFDVGVRLFDRLVGSCELFGVGCQ